MLRRQAILRLTLAGIFLACSTSILTPTALGQGRRGISMGRNPATARPERLPKTPKSTRTPLDEFQRMSPQERQKALDKLPADRAEKLRKQLQEYSKLTPEQQAVAKEQLQMFHNLPPERQQAMRKVFNQFLRQPSDRQQAMRQELNQLRDMPEADRQARLASPDLKSRFSKNEHKMLEEMSGLLPDD